MRVQFTLVRSRTASANPETLFQLLAGTNHRCTIIGMDIGLQGIVPAAAPVVFDFIVQADAGTPGAGATTLTPQKNDRGIDETIVTSFTCFDDIGTSVEPTPGVSLCEFSLHEQGYTHWRPPFPFVAKTAERIGFRYKRDADCAVSLTLYCEE